MPMKFDAYHMRGNSMQPPNMSISWSERPDPIAEFAMNLLNAPGVLVIGDPDGEDSAGRAKAKERPVQAVVTRAFDIAEAAFAEARKRDLLIDIPTFDEIDDFAKSRSDRN